MNVQGSRIERLAYAQFVLYISVWLFGIYINGFEPSPQDASESFVSFFLSPAVITHFTLAIAASVLGIMLLALGWVYKLRKFMIFTALSLASIAVAAIGGLTFVFGIGSQDSDSMLMSVGFITAVYLSFFALRNTFPKLQYRGDIRAPLVLCLVVLGLFYVVFISGMYVNLFLASSVFSQPPAVARQMLEGMITSPPVLFHEFSGVLLVAFTIVLTVSLFRARFSRPAILGAICSLLITYSLLEGIFSNILPSFRPSTGIDSAPLQFITSVIAPLASAAGFLIAIIIAMIIAQMLWKVSSQPQSAKELSA